MYPNNIVMARQWLQVNPRFIGVVGEIAESGYLLRDKDKLIDLDNAQGYQHFD